MKALTSALWIAIMVVFLAIITLRICNWVSRRADRRHWDTVNAASRERMGQLVAAMHYHDSPRGQSVCLGGAECPDGGEGPVTAAVVAAATVAAAGAVLTLAGWWTRRRQLARAALQRETEQRQARYAASGPHIHIPVNGRQRCTWWGYDCTDGGEGR
jgi:hypothetical protein